MMKLNLSDSEWKLMNRLWSDAPMTITELTAALRDETGWSKNTVITMLSRLESKGAVRYEEGSRAKRYFPAVAREDAAMAETENFLSKVYGGPSGIDDERHGGLAGRRRTTSRSWPRFWNVREVSTHE